MKKFLLIIAVATAGLIPQLAFCTTTANPAEDNAINAMKIATYAKIKLDHPGVDPLKALPAISTADKTGPTEEYTEGTCPIAQRKAQIRNEEAKVLDSDRAPGRPAQQAGEAI